MFGIGMTEFVVIMVIALVVIGPGKLPDLANAIGKGLAEFRRASNDIMGEFISDEEIKAVKEDTIDTFKDFKDSLENMGDAADKTKEDPDEKADLTG